MRWRSDRRLRLPGPYCLAEEQALGLLAATAAPTAPIIVYRGMIDRDHPRVRARLAAIAEPAVHECPGNHHLHLETPRPVAERLRKCLLALRPPTPPAVSDRCRSCPRPAHAGSAPS